MISYDQALAIVLTSVQSLPAVQLPLLAASGLILAQTAKARWDMPAWDNSAMDGFACAAKSLQTAEPLRIVGAAYAGHLFDAELASGAAIRITTGAGGLGAGAAPDRSPSLATT